MLFEKSDNRSESSAEVSPHFKSWNINRHAMDLIDSDIFTTIFRETLKDYEMLIEEVCKRTELDAGVRPHSTCGIGILAIWISRIQILLCTSSQIIS